MEEKKPEQQPEQQPTVVIKSNAVLSMPPYLHVYLQIAAFGFQIIIPVIPGITPEWKTLSQAIVSFLQTVLGVIARYSPTKPADQ